MNKNIVAVFNSEWQVLFWVDLAGADLTAIPEVGHVADEAEWILGQLKDRDPQLQQPLKDENGCAIGFVTIPMSDERYMEAVRDELRRVSLRAHIVGSGLKESLQEISAEGFNSQLRLQVVPDIIGLPEDQAALALKAVLGV